MINFCSLWLDLCLFLYFLFMVIFFLLNMKCFNYYFWKIIRWIGELEFWLRSICGYWLGIVVKRIKRLLVVWRFMWDGDIYMLLIYSLGNVKNLVFRFVIWCEKVFCCFWRWDLVWSIVFFFLIIWYFFFVLYY